MRLGVLGGTFDPVHLGHLVLAESALQQLGLAVIVWVPSGNPWRKAERLVTAGEHRLAMVERAVAGHKHFEVSALEIERAGPSYTVDTLVEIQREYTDAELAFVMGEDALRDLPNWSEPKRLLELARIAVAPRGSRRPTTRELDSMLPNLAKRVDWVDMPRIDISGSALRQRVAEGHSLRYLVPRRVEAYIVEHCLYRKS